MEKKLNPIVTVFTIIVIVIACILIYTLIISQSDNNEGLVKTPYTNTEHGWSINYPVGWQVLEGVYGDANFRTNSSDDIFLTIRVEPPESEEPTTLEDEIEMMQEFLTNASNGYHFIILERDRMVNNMNSFEFVYKYGEEPFFIKTKHIFIEKEGRVFKILYTAGINSYDKYESLAEKCINTFEIIEIENFT
jgi:hypothetical protein